ncbi:hypothetical protein [Gryllotalpicola protaetiae]|uniref:Uncharacterized protein n=1 Tax=Gryllotalpicola protaetiae TaxID=2419771 RepID=A0A387BL35_9MICO|nr:hypothetical protein [Gryllotalpicola protaetiae]AYG03368.1 hypothetical protein D7I44_07370 [Gryllotalpicola protaetiae]
MVTFIADPGFFRADAVAIDWASIAKSQSAMGVRVNRPVPALTDDQLQFPLRLSWACRAELGVPHGVFTVWERAVPRVDLKPVDAAHSPIDGGTLVTFGQAAGRVVISGTASNVGSPSTVKLSWGTPTAQSIVAAQSQTSSAAATNLVFDLRCPGADCAVVSNLTNLSVAIVPLAEIVNASDWKEVEYVGLPVKPGGLAGTDYDGDKQGLVSALTSARDAAISRLTRGAPPLGWFPVLPSGVAAPTWAAPDLDKLVEVIEGTLLDRVAALYRPGLPEHDQALLSDVQAVDGPGAGVTPPPAVVRPATVDAAPWPLLVLPAATDPFYNLALGFGTALPRPALRQGPLTHVDASASALPEFMVTARYADGPVLRFPELNLEIPMYSGGDWAAYCPLTPHATTPAPVPFTAGVSGRTGAPVPSPYSLQPPTTIDQPWRENVRSTWNPAPAGAAFAHVTEYAPVRYAAGAAQAEALFDEDLDYGGWKVPTIPAADDAGVLATVDRLADIPLGSGGRHEGYGAAHSDLYGVWSPWSESVYAGTEPAAEPPMLANLKLATHYAGTPQCPATLEIDAFVEWRERSTTSVEFAAVFYPMAALTDGPPSGASPTSAPAGSILRTFSAAFAGDVPTGVGCTVTPYDADGAAPTPAGPGQGEPRRYRAHVDLPPLDFSTTFRWGVEVWARRALAVGPSPSAWAPADEAHAMRASVGSPVPVIPATVPLPGVPLASLPDSNGCSHVQVAWGAPGGTNVAKWVIWQASEEYLRERCGVADPDPRTVPGRRLVDVRQLLVDHPEPTRLAFRRVLEAPAAARAADVALARGSNSMQFFVVTSTTDAGADAPWPYNSSGVGGDHTQVFIAPRVLRPSPPLARPAATVAGLQLDLEVPSDVPVSTFRVYSVKNFDAARHADSMGAPVLVTALAPVTGDTDLVTGQQLYRASTVLALAPSWKPWYLRVVAVPDVSGVPELGVRGLLSPESDIVTAVVPPTTPPDLDALVITPLTADHTGMVARTATTAPEAATPFGTHRLGAVAGSAAAIDTEEQAQAMALADFSALSATDPSPLPAAGTTVLVRGPRAGGETPLAAFFTRADATQPIDVLVRIVDPMGRITEQRATAPGWSPNPPNLTLVSVTASSATATVVTVSSTENRVAEPPFVLSVKATTRPLLVPRLPSPLPGPAPLPLPRPTTLTAQIDLPDIPRAGGLRPPRPLPSPIPLPRPTGSGIEFAYRLSGHIVLYDILIPLGGRLSASVTLRSPDGTQTTVTASA